jgi:hypothetical protein
MRTWEVLTEREHLQIPGDSQRREAPGVERVRALRDAGTFHRGDPQPRAPTTWFTVKVRPALYALQTERSLVRAHG